MKKYLNTLALIAGASFVGAASAQAQLLAYDGIDYPQGSPGSVAGNNGGSGDWAGAWTDKNNLSAVIGGMSYSTLPVVGNSIAGTSTTSSSSEAERVLNHTFGFYASQNTYQANTLWMSYLWASDNTGNGGLFRQASLMFLQGATASAGSGGEYLDIGMPNISAANQATVNPNISLWYGGHGLAGQTGGSTAPNVQSSVAANNYNTYFILIGMTLDNTSTTADTINVWIDPTLDGNAPVTPADLTYSLQDLSSINAIRFQAGGVNATYGGAGVENADEIRIGWTANSVETMSVANVVPEPASMALMGFGGLSLLLFRRKK